MAEMLGNEENMDKVKTLMKQAEEVNQGGDARDIVTVDYTSEEGNRYTGKVQFKRPTVMETMRMGGRKSEIIRESGAKDLNLVDPGIRMLAQAISTLEVVVVKCPEWLLDIHGIKEPDLLFHVYGKYEGWQHSFRILNRIEQTGDSEASE